MREIIADLRAWRARGDERVVIATLVAARGSSPRPIGSKLALSERGELAGSVSGGCVENEVYEEAQAILAGAESKLCSYGITDEQAWSVGLPCGGGDRRLRRADAVGRGRAGAGCDRAR